MPSGTVTLSYLGYAVALALSAAAWLAALFDHVVYGRAEEGLLDERWRDIAWTVGRQAEPALALAAACGGLAFLAALPALFQAGEAAPVAQAHRVYQMKSAAILVCVIGLVALGRVRMGEWDADIAAVAVFAWGAWVVIAGWLAYGGGVAVAGPAGWWLAAGAAVLAVVGIGLLMFLIWLEGGIRMF
ncbi:MAG: hypothetical protein ACM35H_05790 [Bacteroidota bacterium]|nr:hypothetical protein [Kiloniellaceae bacterium]